MKPKYIASLDQGTTSSRCVIFDASGAVKAKAQYDFPQIYPQPGMVEHDPAVLISSLLKAAKRALASAGLTYENIDSVGITNQRETVVVWNKRTGIPVTNAIVWQDRRTAELCKQMKSDGLAPFIYEKTGLVPDPYFSAAKIKWVLDNVPGARAAAENGELLCGTADCWLIWNLTGGKAFATDYTNASRTMLFNIHTFKWDDDLLKLFGIPRQMLPSVHLSSHPYGLFDKKFFGGSMKIAGVAGDQQAALFGHLCTEEGSVKNTYGTGCFMLMHTGGKAAESQAGLLTTIAAGYDKKENYALEGSVFMAGAAVQWLRDELGVVKTAAESETSAKKVPDTNGVYVVPAFTGLGAPYWDPDARGTVTGLTRGANKYHLTRACLEAIAYQSDDVLRAMERDAGKTIAELAVDGGASANNFLMQFQADISNAKIIRPKVLETTALGAAYLAGLCTGYFKSIGEIKNSAFEATEFTPSMQEDERQKKLDGWAKAVLKTRGFQ